MKKDRHHKEIVYIKTYKTCHEKSQIKNHSTETVRNCRKDDGADKVNHPEKNMQIKEFFNFHSE